jgi:hypothetical protein
MRALLPGFVLVLAALFSTASQAGECRKLLESDVKIAAMRSYADLLALAAHNGWNYPPETTDAGERRHFEEMKARLIASGYVIVPVGSDARCRPANTVASE